MATEAQRLIGISLSKIAQSRAHRGGVSLHKNLLVATVLQKARYIFMEEAYHMVHYNVPIPAPSPPVRKQHEALEALTAEETGIEPITLTEDAAQETTPAESALDFLQPCVRCTETDKENLPPTYQSGELTYLDLDKTPNNVLKEKSNCLKRRRAVAEWETEEAVLSILPKRSRSDEESDDSVFLDDASLLSDCVAREVEAERAAAATVATTTATQEENSPSSAMEIDRITSLVSIFSFGSLAGSTGDNLGKLSRSVSTPDLCSAQAKDTGDTIQQRPFLAMTV